ncbi:MAG: Uma2 family endonuclease [Coleofasciculaceae cyanobacterium]
MTKYEETVAKIHQAFLANVKITMPTTALSLDLEPGQKATLQPVSWQRFEAILAQIGERRSSRIAYANSILEIMVPLPEHERSKVLIADLVKVLLKAEKRRWEPLGSTTFKREGMAAGIEPDDCFYIQNCKAVIGKNRLDLSVDPPPDLALETDVTSKTELAAYQALQVPELWIYSGDKLTINVLRRGRYIDSETSPTFPSLAVREIIPQFVQRAREVGVSQSLEEFEAFIQNQ